MFRLIENLFADQPAGNKSYPDWLIEKAIDRAEEAGFEVAAVLCLVDREQGAGEALKSYPFFPLYTATELLSDPQIQSQLQALERED